jgi:hypothetical protein
LIAWPIPAQAQQPKRMRPRAYGKFIPQAHSKFQTAVAPAGLRRKSKHYDRNPFCRREG